MFPLISSVVAPDPQAFPGGQVAVTATAPGAFPAMLSPTFIVVVLPRFALLNLIPAATVGAVAGSICFLRRGADFFAFAGAFFGFTLAVGLRGFRAGAAFFLAAFVLVAIFFVAMVHLASVSVGTIADPHATGRGRYTVNAEGVNPRPDRREPNRPAVFPPRRRFARTSQNGPLRDLEAVR